MKSIVQKIKYWSLKIFGQFYLVFIGIVVVSFFYVSVSKYLWPTYQEVRLLENSNLQVAEGEEKELEQHLVKLKNLKKNYDNFSKQQLEKLKKILPNKADIPGLFVQLQDFAAHHKMKLHSVGISDSQGSQKSSGSNEPGATESSIGDTIVEVGINFSVSGGDYEDMKRFLTDVEHHMRLIDITSLSLGTFNGGPYGFNVKTYYAK
jgi:Tfp pilus assembly protein PilO